MSDMEHMRMRWKAVQNLYDESWEIVSEDDMLEIASAKRYFHKDDSGERTAKAICDAHNAALDADKRLRDLLSQWRETAKIYATHPGAVHAASGYRECISELEAVMAGDLRPIEPMKRGGT